MAAKEISVKKYVVRLSGEERERLETLIRKGKSPARRVLKARILLKADVSEAGKGWSDNRIIDALETSPFMVYRVRKQLVEEGFEAVLSRKPRAMPAVARIFDGEKEAKLIALACSKPPKGRARWTLRLLENKVVELGIVDRASDSTIGRALKKTLQPHRRQHWVIPPKANSAFVAAMEDVLAVYTRPRNGDCPLVCLDESSKQLIAETRVPIPMKAGCPARFDYEYERNGTANLFMMFAPLEGWRHVTVTDRHTAVDYARVLKDLADIHFAHAKTIVLVQDNLSIHRRLHSTKPFRPSKPGAWSSASNGTTLQNTAAGSIWPSLNSIAAFPTNKSSSTKSPPGSTTAVPTTPRQTGNSPPKMLASNLSIYTLQSD